MKSKSPAVTPTIEMSFPDAIRQIIAGRKVTRLEWDNKEIYILLWGEFLSIYQHGKVNQLIVSSGDMLATDWIVLEDTVTM